MSPRIASLAAVAGLALAIPASGQQPDRSRAYSSELIADAAGRTSALAQDPRAFTVNVNGYTQFRYIWTSLDDDDLEEDNVVGFQMARTRVQFSGNVINENWGYFIMVARDGVGGDAAGTARLLDAYGTYRMENGWNLMFGQFKLPLTREELVPDTRQLTAERSPTGHLFTQGWSQGVQLGFEGEAFRFAAAFSDGLQTRNTDYTSEAEADFGLTARLEWKWAGEWKQFRDFTSFPNSDYAGMLGVAGHYQSGGDTLGTEDASVWFLTADASMEGNGWNLFGAVHAVHTDPDAGDDFTDFAWLIQGGFFVAPQWEIFARFDMIIPDGDRDEFDDTFSTLTAGVTHYFVPESHTAKFTAQVIYFFDNHNESMAPLGTRIPLIATGEDGQFSILGQVQLVF
jgi:hypothetical protein